MRKNQKYSKEEMYLAIELWQESGLSQGKFWVWEKLSVKTFSYWYRKYKKEKKGLPAGRNNEVAETFIPMKVSGDRTANVSDGEFGRIEVSFLNGVQLSCPVGIDIGQLKSLINF